MRAAIAGLLLGLTGCAGVEQTGVPVTGRWGGIHVGLSLTASGGSLEYDCAAGTIGPVVPGPYGHFSADGMHTPGMGGPEIEDQPRPAFSVIYTGTVQGDRMTFAGRLDNGVHLGPFTLRRGAEPTIFRCL
jgi:hypothetical protein